MAAAMTRVGHIYSELGYVAVEEGCRCPGVLGMPTGSSPPGDHSVYADQALHASELKLAPSLYSHASTSVSLLLLLLLLLLCSLRGVSESAHTSAFNAMCACACALYKWMHAHLNRTACMLYHLLPLHMLPPLHMLTCMAC
jgi:hypothetical protein